MGAAREWMLQRGGGRGAGELRVPHWLRVTSPPSAGIGRGRILCAGFVLWSSSYSVPLSHKLTNKNMITENAPWQTLLWLQR